MLVCISKIELLILEFGYMFGSIIFFVWLCLLCCRGMYCKMLEYGEKYGGLMGRVLSYGVCGIFGLIFCFCVVFFYIFKIFNGY